MSEFKRTPMQNKAQALRKQYGSTAAIPASMRGTVTRLEKAAHADSLAHAADVGHPIARHDTNAMGMSAHGEVGHVGGKQGGVGRQPNTDQPDTMDIKYQAGRIKRGLEPRYEQPPKVRP